MGVAFSGVNNINIFNKDDFLRSIESRKHNKKNLTYFSLLDKKLDGIMEGLYIIGGVTSVGKTSFIQQIADNMAKRNNKILYFNLEQDNNELIIKSISRDSYITDELNSMDYKSIYNGKDIESIKRLLDIYSMYSSNISYVYTPKIDVEEIDLYIQEYLDESEEKPIVFIDYLQIINTKRSFANDKQKVDFIVTYIKDICKKYGLSIFLVSALNRTSYYQEIDFDSFKESGLIEYTADVLLGLQYNIHKDKKESSIEDKKRNLDIQKSLPNKHIELKCIKNRYGKTFAIKYMFYSEYSYFHEIEEVIYF